MFARAVTFLALLQGCLAFKGPMLSSGLKASQGMKQALSGLRDVAPAAAPFVLSAPAFAEDVDMAEALEHTSLFLSKYNSQIAYYNSLFYGGIILGIAGFALVIVSRLNAGKLRTGTRALKSLSDMEAERKAGEAALKEMQ
uniref:Transmembrane protein n=1 Tax=Chromera velia CCMP2878 TaxID=1169474 RepID=A0A0G4IAG2_9ALVE|mmetsp:Transcript_56116/g.109857  ORF Transcript_56116/g.109857 Transcript_56116/m.109857 type:complete len:141 (-) Transcript_56116:877-1299(-)|eukprot:Cvel_12527.t1-p1 / transcript=Cvel_12527.t1 / gene=Cvel_12527 / organism=Chromera_velia_CCMP2878 / gene_product=hypothetical protein / transcript_product=hypothetical protein / location=Cvel_scaffold822:45640-46059(+) / protein_length=140 / sequence_SO=supercontig / SO=protein_coding / is_pseudo=false